MLLKSVISQPPPGSDVPTHQTLCIVIAMVASLQRMRQRKRARCKTRTPYPGPCRQCSSILFSCLGRCSASQVASPYTVSGPQGKRRVRKAHTGRRDVKGGGSRAGQVLWSPTARSDPAVGLGLTMSRTGLGTHAPSYLLTPHMPTSMTPYTVILDFNRDVLYWHRIDTHATAGLRHHVASWPCTPCTYSWI